jgi:hypothetical protein
MKPNLNNYLITLTEAVTLEPKQHNFGVNLKANLYQETDKDLQHGPRIKFFKSGQENKPIKITLNIDPDKIKVITKKIVYLKIISESKLNKLLVKIKFYRIALLNACYDTKMRDVDVIKQMKEIDEGNIPKYIGNSRRIK